MRLIDADALLKDAETDKAIINSLADIVDIRNLVITQPTIDAVEVVRCKDCHYHDVADKYCCWWENDVNDDDFCSFAKKDGENE